jgi:hypothetical protein
LSKAVREASVVDPITGRYLDQNGPTRAREVNSIMREWWMSYTQDNDGKEPTHAEWRAEMDKTIQQSFRLVRVSKLEDVTDDELQDALVPAVAPPSSMKPAVINPGPAAPKPLKQSTDQDVRSRIERLSAKSKRKSD